MSRDKKGRFTKGNSGRRRGVKNRQTQACEVLLDGEAEALTRKAVELALAGDTVALKLCMDRIFPAPKGRRIQLSMPTLIQASDAARAIGEVVEGVAQGNLTLPEANELSRLLDDWRTALETADLEERIAALEREQGRF